ncbi:unnamed protein product (mitochondrion) [Plasmodiophora brassicae]|uniref:Retroviral polymerase SH3-like domain-containing protein n=1 Tax=Plasmodiophora brassicae TaxID=37360 RepID=A0A3P3Y456_PLABS|nr:unnamed protein product [Plasmodiophora brassicae]
MSLDLTTDAGGRGVALQQLAPSVSGTAVASNSSSSTDSPPSYEALFAMCQQMHSQVQTLQQENRDLKAHLQAQQSNHNGELQSPRSQQTVSTVDPSVDWTKPVKTPDPLPLADRLRGVENFHAWSKRIHNALKQTCLSAFLTGAATCPAKLPGADRCQCPESALTQFHQADRAVTGYVCNQIVDLLSPDSTQFDSADAQRDSDLSGRSRKCIFLGYDEQSSGYVLYDPSEHKFFPTNRDVYFNEDEFPFRHMDRSDPLFDWEQEDPRDTSYVPDILSEGTDSLDAMRLGG